MEKINTHDVSLSSSSVSWQDRTTKITQYKYVDGTKHYLTITVDPTDEISWSSDKLYKTTKTIYGNGDTEKSKVYVAPTISGGAYTSGGILSDASTSQITKTFGDGSTSITNGGSVLPFYQNNLVSLGIKDPNAHVYGDGSENRAYNLTWGTQDVFGDEFSSWWGNGVYAYNTWLYDHGFYNWKALSIGGSSIYGPGGIFSGYGYPQLEPVSDDVKAAWADGWTGYGKNITILDFFKQEKSHGPIVTAIAAQIAPGSDINWMDYPIAHERISYGQNTLYYTNMKNPVYRGQSFYNIGTNSSAGRPSNNGYSPSAINLSLGSNDLSAGQLLVAQGFANFLKDQYNVCETGNNSCLAPLSFGNSVIVKAAGNNSVNLMNYALNYTLLNDSTLKKRTLIVGALKGNTIADYSNVPGNNKTAQDRFIMENGDTNFVSGYHSYDGADLSNKNIYAGTSFAAPRISGYVALLRHKFSGLSANHTANILLDTAGYDDLQCNPNCDKSIYGQGKANLGKAMSPIGNLR